MATAEDRELLQSHFDALLETLSAVDPETNPKAATFQPNVFPFRLEPREIVAYRRLERRRGGRDSRSCCSGRRRCGCGSQEESEEILGILDDTAITRDAPIFQRARKTLRLADLFLRRLEHLQEQAVLAGSIGDARDLQIVRMRLTREHAGLWLQVYGS